VSDEQPTTADTANGIRDSLATIRRHWRTLEDPPRTPTNAIRNPMASRLPGNVNAISLRTEITHDLAFWVHAWLDDHPSALPANTTLDLTDVPAACRFLERQATAISGWTHAARFWSEIHDHAHDIKLLASPPRRDTMAIGECPNKVGTGPAALSCGTIVRVKAHDPGNIRCKGCGITDTIDGWIIRMVGHEGPATIPQLVPIIHRRLGVVVHERTLRRWLAEAKVTPAGGTGSTPRYERRDVLALVVHLSERERMMQA
jgi:hypothetical protein